MATTDVQGSSTHPITSVYTDMNRRGYACHGLTEFQDSRYTNIYVRILIFSKECHSCLLDDMSAIDDNSVFSQ